VPTSTRAVTRTATRRTPPKRPPSRRHVRQARQRYIAGLAIALLICAAAATALVLWRRPNPQPPTPTTHIAAVDLTGYGTSSDLDTETAARLAGVIAAADASDERLIILSGGADLLDTRILGTFDFDPSCSDTQDCKEKRRKVLDRAIETAENVVSIDEGRSATDLFAMFATASEQCAVSNEQRCLLDVMSDAIQNTETLSFLVDREAAVDVAAIVEQHRALSLLPDLTGYEIRWSGFGTDGASVEDTATVRSFWTTYLEACGAIDPELVRSFPIAS
jgi:hypothetical protein